MTSIEVVAPETDILQHHRLYGQYQGKKGQAQVAVVSTSGLQLTRGDLMIVFKAVGSSCGLPSTTVSAAAAAAVI